MEGDNFAAVACVHLTELCNLQEESNRTVSKVVAVLNAVGVAAVDAADVYVALVVAAKWLSHQVALKIVLLTRRLGHVQPRGSAVNYSSRYPGHHEEGQEYLWF